MIMSEEMSKKRCCEFHDRLDKKLHTYAYSDQPCGSHNHETGKPEYCCFECPVLHDKLNKKS